MSLADKLNAIKEGAKERVPEELRVQMGRATAELRESGILESAFKEGDTLPSFEMSNTKADLISSESLLERGNLVLTFYRGVW